MSAFDGLPLLLPASITAKEFKSAELRHSCDGQEHNLTAILLSQGTHSRTLQNEHLTGSMTRCEHLRPDLRQISTLGHAESTLRMLLSLLQLAGHSLQHRAARGGGGERQLEHHHAVVRCWLDGGHLSALVSRFLLA